MSDKFTGLPEVPPDQRPKIDLGPATGGPGGGAGRWLLIGCGGLFFLVGVLAIVFLYKADDFLGWAFTALEETVMARLPEDLPAADRQRLHGAFERAIDEIVTGEADAASMQDLQRQLTRITRSPGKTLTREQVAELTAALEAVVGPQEPGPGGAAGGEPGAAGGSLPPSGSDERDGDEQDGDEPYREPLPSSAEVAAQPPSPP